MAGTYNLDCTFWSKYRTVCDGVSRKAEEQSMNRFQLFDSVRLREKIILPDDRVLPAGTPGAIVEMFPDADVYLVELFGNWVKRNDNGDFITVDSRHPEAFMETIGIETFSGQQLELAEPAQKTVGARTHLLAVVDDLSEEMVTEVADFAQFLREKQMRQEMI
jgi:hypothetical protein